MAQASLTKHLGVTTISMKIPLWCFRDYSLKDDSDELRLIHEAGADCYGAKNWTFSNFLQHTTFHCSPMHQTQLRRIRLYFKKNGPTLASFLFIFGLFKQTSLQFLQQIYVKKCPSSIRCWDLNPQPSERESPPITTRPGLRPMRLYYERGSITVRLTSVRLVSIQHLHLNYRQIYLHGWFQTSKTGGQLFCDTSP